MPDWQKDAVANDIGTTAAESVELAFVNCHVPVPLASTMLGHALGRRSTMVASDQQNGFTIAAPGPLDPTFLSSRVRRFQLEC